MSFLLSFSEEVRIASLLFPPSPRLRLVKNVTDTKLVKNLAKYQRFSIGSLRKTADWLYYFTRCFRHAVNLHILTAPYLFLFPRITRQVTAYSYMITAMKIKNSAANTQFDPHL